mgnify:CR=1 FL=1
MPKMSEELIAKRKQHFLPTASLYHKYPIQLVRAKGEYVWDNSGRQYLDGIGGIVCISAGHNHPLIKKALIEMMENDHIQHTSLLYLSAPVVELAEKLLQEVPPEIDRCSFTNSGSEANELAFLMARQATGETTILHLSHSYHGGTSAALSVCGHHTWRFRAQPVPNVITAEAPYCYRCPFKQKPESCSLECAKHVESTIQTSSHGKIAAMICEPVMGVGGFITPPDAYFSEVTRIVHNHGGKYISDEVQTGAGRCGKDFLLSKTLKIDADIITMAKGLGNGAPIGGLLCKSDVASSMAGKFYFNTFGGDPFPVVQARLTLEIIAREKLVENADEQGSYLIQNLRALMKKHSLIGDVRGRGLLIGVELVKDPKTKTHATEECARLMDLCKDKGLLLGKGGLFGNVLRIAPPLSMNRKQIDEIIKIIDESLYEVAR